MLRGSATQKAIAMEAFSRALRQIPTIIQGLIRRILFRSCGRRIMRGRQMLGLVSSEVFLFSLSGCDFFLSHW